MKETKQLEGAYFRLFKEDLDKLREMSEVKGELIYHVRKAVSEYVKKMEGK